MTRPSGRAGANRFRESLSPLPHDSPDAGATTRSDDDEERSESDRVAHLEDPRTATHVRCAGRKRSGAARRAAESARRSRVCLSSRLGQSPRRVRPPPSRALSLALSPARPIPPFRYFRGEKFSVATWDFFRNSIRPPTRWRA